MKNLVLERIQNQILDTQTAASAVVAGLETEAYKIFNIQMGFKQGTLQDLQDALDASKDLTDVDGDEYPHRVVRFEFSKLIDTNNEFEKELLKRYLEENYHTHVDFLNGVATTSEGPCIIINEVNEAYDQEAGKYIVTNRDASTVKELCQQIEAYMESSGYFPSVVRYGRHGVIGYVNTKEVA